MLSLFARRQPNTFRSAARTASAVLRPSRSRLSYSAFIQRRVDVSSTPQRLMINVPAPATWALMILGFGLAGASLRRRNGIVSA